MRLPLFAAFCALIMGSTLARTVFLKQATPVFQVDSYGDVEEKGTFLAGTEVVLYGDRVKIAGIGRAILIKRIVRPDLIDSRYRHSLALEINRTSHYNEFLMREADLEARGQRTRVAPIRTQPIRRDPVPSRRDVIVSRRQNFDAYEVCYETPRRRVVTMNESQRQRGNRNIGGGLLGVIGGQVIGGITGNDNLGDFISAVGAGFAAVGAVQVATSSEVFYTDYDVDCRSYYQPRGRRTFTRRGQSCTTTHYYSSSWNHEAEYYETVCGRGSRSSRFISFERSHEIYPY